jgi:hypothetical protein
VKESYESALDNNFSRHPNIQHLNHPGQIPMGFGHSNGSRVLTIIHLVGDRPNRNRADSQNDLEVWSGIDLT